MMEWYWGWSGSCAAYVELWIPKENSIAIPKNRAIKPQRI